MPPPVNSSLVCPNCSESLADGDCYVCDICVRPIGGCQKCAWFGFTDTTDAPQQCDRPDCDQVGSGRSDGEGVHKRLSDSVDRIARVQREMKEHSGSFYELAKERSRIIQAAWRAAGSPRKVSMVRTPDGFKYVVFDSTSENRFGYEFVTEDEYNAWIAWRNERKRLRKEFR